MFTFHQKSWKYFLFYFWGFLFYVLCIIFYVWGMKQSIIMKWPHSVKSLPLRIKEWWENIILQEHKYNSKSVWRNKTYLVSNKTKGSFYLLIKMLTKSKIYNFLIINFVTVGGFYDTNFFRNFFIGFFIKKLILLVVNISKVETSLIANIFPFKYFTASVRFYCLL